MALLGVLLGISIAVLGWGVYEIRDQKKLIIELQNTVIFDMGSRISALERRKAVVAEPVAAAPKPTNIRRQWSEDIPMKEAN